MDDFNDDGWMDGWISHGFTGWRSSSHFKAPNSNSTGGTESCKAAIDEATIHATNVLKSSKNGSRKVHNKKEMKKYNEMGIWNILNIKLQLE